MIEISPIRAPATCAKASDFISRQRGVLRLADAAWVGRRRHRPEWQERWQEPEGRRWRAVHSGRRWRRLLLLLLLRQPSCSCLYFCRRASAAAGPSCCLPRLPHRHRHHRQLQTAWEWRPASAVGRDRRRRRSWNLPVRERQRLPTPPPPRPPSTAGPSACAASSRASHSLHTSQIQQMKQIEHSTAQYRVCVNIDEMRMLLVEPDTGRTLGNRDLSLPPIVEYVLEALARVQAGGLLARHQERHGLQDCTQLHTHTGGGCAL